ncbi:MAG: hypothetical protein IKT27_01195 [Clostridia bacterium]|nr:hypothetical protein [Clostridia bacterium]
MALADFVCGCNTPNQATLVASMKVALATPPCQWQAFSLRVHYTQPATQVAQ